MGISWSEIRLCIFLSPVLLLIFAVIIVVRRKKGARVSLLREVLKLLFAVYLLAVFSLTLFPFHMGRVLAIRGRGIAVNLVPVRGIVKSYAAERNGFSAGFILKELLLNIGGNVLLFAPMGFFVPVLFRRFRSFRRTVLLCLAASVCVELLQLAEQILLIDQRMTDIDDVLQNTAGACLGFLAYRILSAGIRRFSRNKQISSNTDKTSKAEIL